MDGARPHIARHVRMNGRTRADATRHLGDLLSMQPVLSIRGLSKSY